MTWEIRNVGWPIPYGDTWPVSQKQTKPAEVPYLFEHRDQIYIQLYGYNFYQSELNKGVLINTWI